MSILIRTPYPSIARVARTLGITPERMKELGEFVMSLPPSKRAARVSWKAAPKARRRKPLTAAARRRISLAQKRRWAEYRKKVAGAV